MNLFIKQKQTHSYIKQIYGYQREKRIGESADQEFGISRYKLLYTKQIKNKVPQYITENYIQYLVLKYNRKEHEK